MVYLVPYPELPIAQNQAQVNRIFLSDDPEIFYTNNEKHGRLCCASRTIPFVINHFAANQ